MATFPSITPTYGVQKRSAPNTRTVKFADGYEHRILFGLAQHQNPKIFTFTFNVSETDADTICLLYTSPSPRDLSTSRMPSSA